MTAAELMEKLAKDKAYQTMAAKREQERRAQEAILRIEELELLADLANVGVQVNSVWDLVNTADPYPAAVPVLFDHLRRSYTEKTKEGIARALAVPEAGAGWDILLVEYHQTPDEVVKFAIGCALSVIARVQGRVDEVLALLRDSSVGDARLAVLDVLALSKAAGVRSKLREFANDPVLGEQARWYLEHPGRQRR